MSTPAAAEPTPVGAVPPPEELPDAVLRGPEPIRGELYGPERLEARARQVAHSSARVTLAAGRDLLDRCAQDSRTLHEAHRRLTAAAAEREVLSGEAEWFLDNFHIIAEALREVRTDLPPGYYRKLPKL